MIRTIVFILSIFPIFALAGKQVNIHNIISFGDSLSDASNKHLISLYMNQASNNLISVRALPPNVSGRFSNGFTWVDQLHISFWRQPSFPALKVINSTMVIETAGENHAYPLKVNSLTGNNWSVGGAMTGDGYLADETVADGSTVRSGTTVLPNIGQQISDYLAQHKKFAPTDLVLIQGGTNNLWFTLFANQGDTGTSTALKLVEHIKQLQRHGAKHILVMNIPPLYLGAWLNPFYDQAKAFVDEFNQSLAKELDHLIQLQTSANIYLMDADVFLTKVVKQIQTQGEFYHQPTAIRLSNVSDSAWNWVTNEVVEKPNQYIFWDGLHPTAAVHRLLAYQAEQLLEQYGIIPAGMAK
ncbi:SGNH/GDSL hydrolase family protein [Endozoicomonas sp. SM1973]|uniref:SGNH/GDSL hydrolase family protein n=1 Tax=Spartinivicinus marinus TaxID=2994442 RepID=A0A853I5A3_9GAMM|nr:SGNH/GDSL hydrolase family protein [Spartinivicinus marinus]MCX4029547.1 SGNH/GDSL hydrolase family protein [Spartinivicinus marinus]NYZ65121.1 SGNH/GDSL hydrolase family protein [Spartinivicinus marinus]